MDMSKFEQDDIKNRHNLDVSFREEAITFGASLISGIGGAIIYGNAAKAVYSIASSNNYEFTSGDNAIMAAFGLAGGLVMNSMIYNADSFDDDKDYESKN